MTNLGVFAALKNAFAVLFKNFGIALFIAVIAGGLGSVVEWTLGDALGSVILGMMKTPVDPTQQSQSELIAVLMSATAVAVLWSGPFGAWQAASTMYLWVQRERGRETNLRDAMNFGMNRFQRVLPFHWRAYLYIALGNLIVVPAILLGLQYAFVDCIATLDERETDPLARSKKLTLPRRGAIFRAFLPFCLWWIPYQLAMTFGMADQPLWVKFAGGTVDGLMLVTIDLVMVQFYLDLFRTSPKRTAGAEVAGVEAAGLAAAGAEVAPANA